MTLRQRMEYGDGGDPAQAASTRTAMRKNNLLGQLHRHHDEAGLTTVTAVDFKGNVLDKYRRVIADAPILAVFQPAPANGWKVTPFQVDWQPGLQQSVSDRERELLESTAYETSARYDALNRVTRMEFPKDVEGKRRELRPVYNRAGGLEQVRLNDTLFVERIAYDAKGQRALIAYGNGVMTRYAYDPRTFRLKRLRSERYTKPNDLSYRPGGEALQDFGYDYDLAGNILAIRDRTPDSGIPNSPQGTNALDRRFIYDAIYRLLSATGRECDRPAEGNPWLDQPRCTNLTKARAYTERFSYDAMGNLLRLEHRNEPGGFTRIFTQQTTNNRLLNMKIGDETFAYTFDANGNMRSETTSRHFEWNHSDQMKAFRTQTEGAEPSIHAHYLYDSTGQRVKKLVRKQGGQVEVTHYIDGAFEHHRRSGGSQASENNHVHVMDDQQRIALVRIGSAHPDDRGPAVQFHLGDHLGSSNVVIDSDGTLINREEFTPYGETSFGSFAKKRYRFTGMERDEESGLSYHSARYYSAWLVRWTTPDPKLLKDGTNLYIYGRNNPLIFCDPLGTDSEPYSEQVSLADEDITCAVEGNTNSSNLDVGGKVIGAFLNDQDRELAQRDLDARIATEIEDERMQASHLRVEISTSEDHGIDTGDWGIEEKDIEQQPLRIIGGGSFDPVKVKGPTILDTNVLAIGGEKGSVFSFKGASKLGIQVSTQVNWTLGKYTGDNGTASVYAKSPGVTGELGIDSAKGTVTGKVGMSFGTVGVKAKGCFVFCYGVAVEVGPKVEVGGEVGAGKAEIKMPLVTVGTELGVDPHAKEHLQETFVRPFTGFIPTFSPW